MLPILEDILESNLSSKSEELGRSSIGELDRRTPDRKSVPKEHFLTRKDQESQQA